MFVLRHCNLFLLISQLLKKISRVLYNILVLFIPWEMRIKKIESKIIFYIFYKIRQILKKYILPCRSCSPQKCTQIVHYILFFFLVNLRIGLLFFFTSQKKSLIFRFKSLWIWSYSGYLVFYSVCRSLWIWCGLILYFSTMAIWD